MVYKAQKTLAFIYVRYWKRSNEDIFIVLPIYFMFSYTWQVPFQFLFVLTFIKSERPMIYALFREPHTANGFFNTPTFSTELKWTYSKIKTNETVQLHKNIRVWTHL